MDTANPPDMIDVTIKNVNVSTDNDFILDATYSGGILSISANVNKEIAIENCNLSVPNGTIKNEDKLYCGGIIGYPAGAEDGQEAKFTIKNCSVTAKNITAKEQYLGGILACGSAIGNGKGTLEIEGCNVNVTEDFITDTNNSGCGGIMACTTIKGGNGDAELKIKNCTVTAKKTIIGTYKSGGIIGMDYIYLALKTR
jgi:hypothetical protein